MGSLHCVELGPYEAYKHLQVLQLNESLGACLADVGLAVNKRPKNMDKEGEHKRRANHTVLNQSKYTVSF